MKGEFPDVQVGFRKGRGRRCQITQHSLNCRESKGIQKKKIFCFIDYTLKPLTVWITTKCGKFFNIWKLRNMYVDQEATIKIWNNGLVHNLERSILSPCLFNFCAEYIMLKCQDG